MYALQGPMQRIFEQACDIFSKSTQTSATIGSMKTTWKTVNDRFKKLVMEIHVVNRLKFNIK